MEQTPFSYASSAPAHTHEYLLPTVRALLELQSAKRLFELGCGNGANALSLSQLGYDVVGVDPSGEGVQIANQSGLNLRVGSTDDDLPTLYGKFPIVLSLEVVEHVYSAARFAQVVHDLLQPGGLAIISTPYHGYLKNVALALSGKLDSHFTALWGGGHIKFWSRQTLRQLFAGVGMQETAFHRVGRFPPFAKSMIATYRRVDS